MQKILTSQQIRRADQYAITHEPISSIDLMERASRAFAVQFAEIVPDKSTSILVCAGTGNNGGDGLAVARILQQQGYRHLSVWIARFGSGESQDFTTNLLRLRKTSTPITDNHPGQPLAPIEATVIIDALLGAGLNKPLQGDFLRLAQHINASNKSVIAIDIPTGLPPEGAFQGEYATVFACHAITFQRPKLNFFFPESAHSLTQFHTVPIGLDETFMDLMPVDFFYTERIDITRIYRKRAPFSHKGTYGHALIIAGHPNTMGAALLCAGACIYSGAGRTSACIPQNGLTALNSVYPEAMYVPRSDISEHGKTYDVIGIGPGLGDEIEVLQEVLDSKKPLVIDADGLNTLAYHPELLRKLPTHCILTPHAKEFDRLFGIQTNWWERVQKARQKAIELQVIIVLKNRYTFIVTPRGEVKINPTGHPAMASGGMGDILTGMITAFLAQGYGAEEAALLGCYLHGAAGERLAKRGMAVTPATRLLQILPEVIGDL